MPILEGQEGRSQQHLLCAGQGIREELLKLREICEALGDVEDVEGISELALEAQRALWEGLALVHYLRGEVLYAGWQRALEEMRAKQEGKGKGLEETMPHIVAARREGGSDDGRTKPRSFGGRNKPGGSER